MSVGLLEVKDGSRLIISLAMFKPADRYEAIIALSTQDGVFQKYSGALGALLKGLRFKNVELPDYELILTAGDKPVVHALFKDGSWLEICPAEGMDGFDTAASKKTAASAWGTQETKDGILQLKVGDRVRSLAIQADGSLSGTNPEATFYRAPASSGIRFEGHYGVKGAELMFKSDGSFEDQGVLGKETGVYEISNNTLTLAGGESGKKRVLFALMPKSALEKSPDRIFVGSRWLKKL